MPSAEEVVLTCGKLLGQLISHFKKTFVSNPLNSGFCRWISSHSCLVEELPVALALLVPSDGTVPEPSAGQAGQAGLSKAVAKACFPFLECNLPRVSASVLLRPFTSPSIRKDLN